MPSESSPGPWKVDRDATPTMPDCFGLVIEDGNGFYVCECQNFHSGPNADHIVRCVNAHDKLMKLAETVLESIPVVAAIGLPMYYDQQKMLQLAREALELAKGNEDV